MNKPIVNPMNLEDLTTLTKASLLLIIPVGMIWFYLWVIKPRRELKILRNRRGIANELLRLLGLIENQLHSQEEQNVGLRMKKGERHLMDLGGVSMIEPRRAPVKYEGAHAGVSIRVAKGVYWRVGRSEARRVPQGDVMKIIDTGRLHITNQRAVFTGSMQNREWRWDKLHNHYHDMDNRYSVIHVSSRQKASGFAHVVSEKETAIICFLIDIGVASHFDEIPAVRSNLLSEIENLDDSIKKLEVDIGLKDTQPPPPFQG